MNNSVYTAYTTSCNATGLNSQSFKQACLDARHAGREPGWVNRAIVEPLVRKAMERGILSALHGSHWSLRDDMLDDLCQTVSIKLLSGSLATWNPELGGLCKFVWIISFRFICSHVKLHRFRYDGSKSAVSVDHCDVSCDDASPACYADDSADTAFARAETKMSLKAAVARLSDVERSLLECIRLGNTAKEWGTDHGLSSVQVTRLKNDMLEKLQHDCQ